jgi:hypothetical protein
MLKKIVAHVEMSGSMIVKIWLVLNFTNFETMFSLDSKSKCQGVANSR